MSKALTAEDFKSEQGQNEISAAEWQARIDLAALYRLAALFGYDDLIWNHITMRVPGTDHQFLLNKFGLLYSEVTASNLIKVDEHGNVLNGSKDVNTAGFIIHSAIHLAHADMKVVFHAHAPAGLAVTALKDGIDYLVQDSAMLYGDIGYHDWEGLSLSIEERDRLAENMHYLIRACKVMLAAHGTGLVLDKSNAPIWQLARRQYEHFPPGKYEWPALLRLLNKNDSSYKY